MKVYSDELHINVGSGEDLSIAELAKMIGEIVGFKGKLVYNAERPDGTPRKLLDVSRLNAMGWRPKIGLEDGLRTAYLWYQEELANQAA